MWNEELFQYETQECFPRTHLHDEPKPITDLAIVRGPVLYQTCIVECFENHHHCDRHDHRRADLIVCSQGSMQS